MVFLDVERMPKAWAVVNYSLSTLFISNPHQLTIRFTDKYLSESYLDFNVNSIYLMGKVSLSGDVYLNKIITHVFLA